MQSNRAHGSIGPLWFACVLVLVAIMWSPTASAFGDSGAFNPRVLVVGNAPFEGVRASAPSRWSWELTRRTSAPARLAPSTVRADAPALLAEPFVWWMGDRDVGVLTRREITNLRAFFALGGVMLVDDSDPDKGEFTRSAKREIGKVITDISPISIGLEHVVFRSFYLVRRAVGRVAGPGKLEALIRGGHAQVLFTSHDLAGALAQDPTGTPSMAVAGGETQRELAIRLAVNIAMFVLCSNYKDDQVHAPYLMRRRARDP